MEETIKAYLLKAGPSALTDIIRIAAEAEGKPLRSKSVRTSVESALVSLCERGEVEADTSTTRKRYSLSAREAANMAVSGPVTAKVQAPAVSGAGIDLFGLSSGFRIRLDSGEVIRKRI